MQKRQFIQAVGAAIAAFAVASPAMAQWKPTRPINLIVPWAAGGSTDQVTRVAAAEMEKQLGQTIVIVNQPGASGAIGTKSAMDAPKDGYTWTAGAAQDLGAYQTLGSVNTNIKDWHLFLSVANIQVIGVNPQRPWQNAKQFIDDMKAKPGQISVATAGVTSAVGSTCRADVHRSAFVRYADIRNAGSGSVTNVARSPLDTPTQSAPPARHRPPCAAEK